MSNEIAEPPSCFSIGSVLYKDVIRRVMILLMRSALVKGLFGESDVRKISN